MTKHSKGLTTFTYFLSIMVGTSIVAFLLGYTGLQQHWNRLMQNPVNTMYELLVSAFTNPLFLGLMTGTVILSIVLTGPGYGLFFIIPFAIVITLANIFFLPTYTILTSTEIEIPAPIKTVYTMLIFTLTVSMIVSFVRGGG